MPANPTRTQTGNALRRSRCHSEGFPILGNENLKYERTVLSETNKLAALFVFLCEMLNDLITWPATSLSIRSSRERHREDGDSQKGKRNLMVYSF